MFKTIRESFEIYKGYLREYLEKIEELKMVSKTGPRRWTDEDHQSLVRLLEKTKIAKELLGLSSEEVQEELDKIEEQIKI